MIDKNIKRYCELVFNIKELSDELEEIQVSLKSRG